MTLTSRVRWTLTAALLATASHGAHALTSWSSSASTCNNGNVGNVCTMGTGAGQLKASAYSNTDTAPAGAWETSTLTAFSGGFGVRNRGTGDSGEGSAPEHAMDNNQKVDSILLSFTSSTILRSLTIGWKQTDADVSVLRYTGNSAPSLLNQTPGGLLSAGWELVVNYANLNVGTAMNINSHGHESSWWLVTAYTSAFWDTTWTIGDDYFKLMTVAGDRAPPPSSDTPEPASLALVGLAVLGLWGSQRRKRA